MNRILWVFCIACLTQTNIASAEAEYQQSGKVMSMSFLTKDWDGKHQFQDVYCATFPTPEKAQDLQSVMFNQNAISLSSVDYDGFIRAVIVVSTMPKNRTMEEEVQRLSKNEKDFVAETGVDTHQTEISTLFGPAIGLRINNMVPGTNNGPFPLARAIFDSTGDIIKSMSVHRLFAYNENRFEIATLQYVPEGANPEKQKVMEKQLTTLADNLTSSLQECTLKMNK